jgi:serine O-acetyltransferase
MLQYIKKIVQNLRKKIQLLFLNEIPLKFLFSIEYPHPIGIVVSSGCIIGQNVVIYQNVTIGRAKMESEGTYPTIGDNVILYPGSVISGKITIGDNVIVGPNATVSKNIPPNKIVGGHNLILN